MNTSDAPPVLPLSVRYSASRWDVLRCRLWVTAHHKKLVALTLIMSLPVPFFVCSDWAPGVPRTTGVVIFTFLFVLLAALSFLVIFQILFQAFWVLINKNRGVVGEHIFEIRDDGLVERTAFNESLHRWAGFYRIAATRSCLFVFVTENQVHYIPFRAFPTKEEAQRFEAELRKRANLK